MLGRKSGGTGRARVVLAAVVAGLVLFTACGGDDDDDNPTVGAGGDTATTQSAGGSSATTDGSGGGGGGDRDPCALLTKADAQNILGAEPGEAEADDRSCTYRTQLEGFVRLNIDEDYQYDFYKDEEESRPVSGVGDEAYRTEDDLYVKDGDFYFHVHIQGQGGEDVEPIFRRAAELVLQKL